MALEEHSAEQGSSSPAASTSRGPTAAPVDASEEQICTICLDTICDEAHISSCRHCFCFPCIQEWARRKARWEVLDSAAGGPCFYTLTNNQLCASSISVHSCGCADSHGLTAVHAECWRCEWSMRGPAAPSCFPASFQQLATMNLQKHYPIHSVKAILFCFSLSTLG
uniref:RING-type E3 ubiquitin transferase n=1 Tax=Amazona collaria TaxID=241587 RepID=A0A8B9G617_9PSIT